MKSRNIIPQETKGHYADDKTGKIKNPNFLWNVDIIHIKSNFVRGLTSV